MDRGIRGKIAEVLAESGREVPGFVSSSVVDMELGEPIASVSSQDFPDNQLAILYSEIIRSHEKHVGLMGIGPEVGETHDIIITTDNYYVLLRPLSRVRCSYAMVIKKNGNLGLARSTMVRYAELIEKALREVG